MPFDFSRYSYVPDEDEKDNAGFDFSKYQWDEQYTLGEKAKDLGIELLQGSIAVPESAVGLADLAYAPLRLATEFATGKDIRTLTETLADNGIDFSRAREVAEQWKSADAKLQNKEIADAFDRSFMEGLSSLKDNPFYIARVATQSLPQMLGIAAGARTAAAGIYNKAYKELVETAGEEVAKRAGSQAVRDAMPALTKISAASEGALQAGSMASDYASRGELGAREALGSVASGVATGLLGYGGGRLAGKIGLEDVEAGLGASPFTGTGSRGRIGNALRGSAQEALFEEFPQSASETIISNLTDGRPITEGLGQSVATGIATGGLMGAGFGFARSTRPSENINSPSQPTNTSSPSNLSDIKVRLQSLTESLDEARNNLAPQYVLNDIETRISALIEVGKGVDPLFEVESTVGRARTVAEESGGDKLDVATAGASALASTISSIDVGRLEEERSLRQREREVARAVGDYRRRQVTESDPSELTVEAAIAQNERQIREAESAGDTELVNDLYEDSVRLRSAQNLLNRGSLSSGEQANLLIERGNAILNEYRGRVAAFNEPTPVPDLDGEFIPRRSGGLLSGPEMSPIEEDTSDFILRNVERRAQSAPRQLPDNRFNMGSPQEEFTGYDIGSARAGDFRSVLDDGYETLREVGSREPERLEPEVIDLGASGNGFATEKSAKAAIRSRQEKRPEYDWTVTQNDSGKYQLTGTLKTNEDEFTENDTVSDEQYAEIFDQEIGEDPNVLSDQDLEEGFDMLDDQVDFSPRRPSDVADIGAAREARDLRNFRSDFMEKVRQGVKQDIAMAKTLKEVGAYDGLEIGDTYITTNRTGKKFRNKVVGFAVSRVDPSDRKGFAEFGPIPESEIIEGPDGKQYKAVLRVETINEDGDVMQSSANMYRLKELGYQRMGGLRATEEGVDFSPRRDTRRLDMDFRDAGKRVPELTEAAQQLRRGEITREQYAQKVNEFKPVDPYDLQDFPKPASQEQIFAALSADKRDRINAEVEDGAKVGLRLDIPAYTQHNTWVPTVHRTINGKDVTSYRSTAAVSNVNFPKFSEIALRIAEGSENKRPFARIRGEFINRTEDENVALAQEALNSPDWIQVGMDPERTGYFYDRNDIETRVVSAEEVIQIGPLVLAKNAVTEPAGDLMFSKKRDGEDGGRDYRLDIERQERTTGSRKRLPKEEAELIRQEAAKLKLSEEQVKALTEEAVRVKNQYPESDGWAPLKLSGVTKNTNDKGEVTYDLKWQEEAYGYNKRSSEKKAKSKLDKEYAMKVAEKFTSLVEDIYKRAKAGDKNAETIISHQTWYRNVTEILRREFGGSADMFADLLGATSPNTPVDTNFKFSVDIMRRFARGDFNRELAAYDKWVKEGKADKDFSDADKIRQVSEKLYGMNSINAQKALLDMWRILKPGTAPKARNFALNLIGQSDMATIDVWAARMLRRAGNMVRGNNLKRIPPPAEKGVTGKWNSKATGVTGEFGFGAAVMDIAVQKLKRKGINVTAPDLQAIAWFAEKELWSKNNWTTKTGEGGSFEENFEAVPTERYVAGWSIQQGKKAPTDEQMTEAQQRVLNALLDDSSVITARAMPTYGLYAEETERSFDTEWTVERGTYNPSKAIQAIAEVSQENNQYDILVSRVVSPEEQNPNARPGVELYFRNQQDLEQVMPTLEAFTSKGVDGFTLVVDPRNSSGDGYIGVRLQFVPEISARWDEDFRAEALAEGGIERIIEEKRDQLNDIVRDLRAEGRVAYANQFDYDTVVVGIENYGEYTNAESGEVDLSTGGQVRLGRSVRQGLERAVARYEGEQRQDGTGSVPDVGSELQPEVDDETSFSPRREPPQPAPVDTALGRIRDALSRREGPALDDAGIKIVLPDSVPSGRRGSLDFALEAARVFQKSGLVNFVKFDQGVRGFNGATYGGQIFIDVDAEYPYHMVLGHELTHVLKRDYPDLYSQLEAMIIPRATERESSARAHGFDMDSEKGREEYVSDVVGNRFGENEFWQSMAEANPKGFRRIAQIARSLMQKLAEAFRMNKVNQGDGVRDLNMLRTEIAKVMSQYRDRLSDNAGVIPDSQIPVHMTETDTPMLSPKRGDQFEDPFSAENARLQEREGSLWERSKKKISTTLRRQLTPGGLLPESVFKEKTGRDNKIAVTEIDVVYLNNDMEKAVRTAYKKKFSDLTPEQKNDIQEALSGRVPVNLPREVKDAAIAMRAHIDLMSSEYVKILQEQASALFADLSQGEAILAQAMLSEGDLDQAKAQAKNTGVTNLKTAVERAEEYVGKVRLMNIISSNQGTYVHRSYKAFDDPNWFQKVPVETLNRARSLFNEQLLKRYPNDLERANRVEVILDDMLKKGTAYESLESYFSESKLGSMDLSILMARKDINPLIRDLLGEHEDARLNYTKSITKMGRLIWNQRFLEAVKRDGMGEIFFTEENRPPGMVRISPEGSKKMSPLNGLYTYPEIAQGFVDAVGLSDSMWPDFIIQMNGAVKFGKTVLSPTTAIRNFMSAAFFSLANGHFDMTKMAQSIRVASEYFSGSGDAASVAYLRKLKDLGVVYDSPRAEEMRRLLEDSLQLVSDQGVQGKVKSLFNVPKKFYSFGDDFWKIIGFENEKANLISYGMSENQAEKEAAERIRNTYPTYSMTGKAIQDLRRNPLVGTFVSFPAEIIRTSWNILKYASKDIKDGREGMGIKRLAGVALVSAGFYALQEYTKKKFDIDDEEEEAIREMSAPWAKNSTLAFAGRDEDGNLRYFDLSFLDPYGYFKRPITAMMRDEPWEELFISSARDLISPFLGPDIGAGTLFDVLSNTKGSGGQIVRDGDGVIQKTSDILEYIQRQLQPGVLKNISDLSKAYRGQYNSSGTKKYSVSDEWWAVGGWRVTTFDPKVALTYRALDAAEIRNQASAVLNAAIRNPNDLTEAEFSSQVDRALTIRREGYEDFLDVIVAARNAGMSDDAIFASIRSSGLSQRDSAVLLQGQIPPMTVSLQSARDAAISDRSRGRTGVVESRVRDAMALLRERQ